MSEGGGPPPTPGFESQRHPVVAAVDRTASSLATCTRMLAITLTVPRAASGDRAFAAETQPALLATLQGALPEGTTLRVASSQASAGGRVVTLAAEVPVESGGMEEAQYMSTVLQHAPQQVFAQEEFGQVRVVLADVVAAGSIETAVAGSAAAALAAGAMAQQAAEGMAVVGLSVLLPARQAAAFEGEQEAEFTAALLRALPRKWRGAPGV